jgi:hypothetical protein
MYVGGQALPTNSFDFLNLKFKILNFEFSEELGVSWPL